MNENEPQLESNQDLTVESELLRWEQLSKMNKDLAAIKKRLDEKDPQAHEDLRGLVLSASMDLHVMISGRDSDELAANVGAAIRKAAEESERKIALARGISYTPDSSE